MEIKINPKTNKDLFSGKTLYDWNGIWIPGGMYRLLCLRMGSATYTYDSAEPLIFSLTQDGYHRFHNMNFHINMDWDNKQESITFLNF